MNLNRRNLLKQLGAGIAASSLLAPQHAAADSSESASDSQSPPQHLEPIRLDRNENAYGASPKAIAAIQEAATGISRYQDSSVLLKTLADHHSETTSGANRAIKAEQIVLGCGSSDVLRMAASAFLAPGATLIMATPTCDLIAQYGRSRGATIISSQPAAV
jgi:histidinol-phosphate aminotransferase